MSTPSVDNGEAKSEDTEDDLLSGASFKLRLPPTIAPNLKK